MKRYLGAAIAVILVQIVVRDIAIAGTKGQGARSASSVERIRRESFSRELAFGDMGPVEPSRLGSGLVGAREIGRLRREVIKVPTEASELVEIVTKSKIQLSENNTDRPHDPLLSLKGGQTSDDTRNLSFGLSIDRETLLYRMITTESAP